MVTYLTYDQIVRLNKKTVEAHGGNFVPPSNLLHGDALLYLIEVVEAEMFGEQMYPTIPDKAGLYMHSIISNHVFQDGNKRTGLGAAMAFLEINGWRLVADAEDDNAGQADIPSSDLYDFTIAVASGERDLDAVRAWFNAHAREHER